MFRIGVHLTSQWERSGTAAEDDIGPYRSPRANLDAGRNAADDFSICSVAESREGSCYILNVKFSCAASNKRPERSGGPPRSYAASAATPVELNPPTADSTALLISLAGYRSQYIRLRRRLAPPRHI